MRNLSDANLVPFLNDLRSDAWAEIGRRYRGYIRAAAHRILDFVDLDDVEQNCWAYLLAMVPDIKPVSLKPLIGSVVRYQVGMGINEVHRARRATRMGWNVSVQAQQMLSLEEQQMETVAMQLLEVATPKERAAIVAHYYLDLATPDAAARIGVTDKALRRRIQQARARMARHAELKSIPALLPDDYGPQSLWPTVSDEKASLYFCNKRNRTKRRAQLTVTMGAA